MGKKKTEIMWAIAGNFGLYIGTALTRKEAIAHHISGRDRTWEYCKQNGDYAVKVKMSYLPKPNSR